MTLVYAASTIEECALPLKSIDTSSSVENARMFFSGPSAAAFSAPFTSSALVFLSTIAARSTTDTFGVGTRMAKPSSLPFRSGSTSPTATAAPVVVGIIERAAGGARAGGGGVRVGAGGAVVVLGFGCSSSSPLFWGVRRGGRGGIHSYTND